MHTSKSHVYVNYGLIAFHSYYPIYCQKIKQIEVYRWIGGMCVPDTVLNQG